MPAIICVQLYESVSFIQRDNDPKHATGVGRVDIEENVQMLSCPHQSPAFNSIENIWQRSKLTPRTISTQMQIISTIIW